MSEKKNEIRIYSLLAGSLYLIFGMAQILVGFGSRAGIGEIPMIASDGVGGVVLVVIGTVFLFGSLRWKKDRSEGIAFILVGTFLGQFFFVIYTLILLADLFEAEVLASEDWDGWRLLDSIRPGIYMGIITWLGHIIFRKDLSMKEVET